MLLEVAEAVAKDDDTDQEHYERCQDSSVGSEPITSRHEPGFHLLRRYEGSNDGYDDGRGGDRGIDDDQYDSFIRLDGGRTQGKPTGNAKK
jgi:hypothetical protein